MEPKINHRQEQVKSHQPSNQTRGKETMPVIDNETHQPIHGLLPCADFLIEVVSMAERKKFGRKEYLIKPVSGQGEAWVWATRIQMMEDR